MRKKLPGLHLQQQKFPTVSFIITLVWNIFLAQTFIITLQENKNLLVLLCVLESYKKTYNQKKNESFVDHDCTIHNYNETCISPNDLKYALLFFWLMKEFECRYILPLKPGLVQKL